MSVLLFPKTVDPDTGRTLTAYTPETNRVVKTQSPKIYNWRIPFIAVTVSESIQTPGGLDLETPDGQTLETP